MRYQLGRLEVVYCTDDPLYNYFYPASDVGPYTIDTWAGLAYSASMEEPTSMPDEIDRWLLDMAEREDVVVSNGRVIPIIIGQVEPRHDLETRYYHLRNRKDRDNWLKLWQDNVNSVLFEASVYLDGESLGIVNIIAPRGQPIEQTMQRVITMAISDIQQRTDQLEQRARELSDLVEQLSTAESAPPVDPDIPY